MQATREAIIAAAVMQFADKGFDGASLREILRDAGVNAASGHYHFGSKQAVYEEVIRSFVTPLCEQRLDLLMTIDPHLTGKEKVEALIRSYVAPHLRLCADPGSRPYVRLLARFINEREDATGAIYGELLAPVRSKYLAALRQAAPQLSARRAERLLGFVVILMASAPLGVSYGRYSEGGALPAHPEALIEDVIAFAASGIWEIASNVETKKSAGRASRPAAQSS